MVYNVTIKNLGTIDAEVGAFTNPIAWETDNILTYSVTGISIGDEILASDTNGVTFTITVEWPAGTDIPTNKTQELEFQIHFIQKGTGSGGSGTITPIFLVPAYTHIDTNGNGIIEQGEQIKFGKYPQTKVTDTALIEALNVIAGDTPTNGDNKSWTSYKYYQEISVCDEDGYCNWSMSNDEDYMWYQDIEEDGEKYRGVYFTSYRPRYTYLVSDTPYSSQDDNGYTTGTRYWFKYEDIVWDVGKNENSEVTLISHTILDSREFYITSSGTRLIDGVTVYPNNYEHSTIREWLNETFYNTAFTTAKEQNTILLREVTQPVTAYEEPPTPLPNVTNDKIFLLNYIDINENLVTYNINREKQGSDYAKAQGLYVDTETVHVVSYYWLRSPYIDWWSGGSYTVGGSAPSLHSDSVDYTSTGVTAALKIGL